MKELHKFSFTAEEDKEIEAKRGNAMTSGFNVPTFYTTKDFFQPVLTGRGA